MACYERIRTKREMKCLKVMSMMNAKTKLAAGILALAALTAVAKPLAPFGPEPALPAFSISNMDRSVSPALDFYSFACGEWVKNNPVPADKSRWTSFGQLAERNSYLIHALLEDAAVKNSPKGTPSREAGDFYISAMDTNRLEQLRFQPIAGDLKRIDGVKSVPGLFRLLAHFHGEGVGGIFGADFEPDAMHSSIYALELEQGGLSLPDRDYYLKDGFAPQREEYLKHVAKMLELLGEKPREAEDDAKTALNLETLLARAGRTRVELRDPNKNYNKFTRAQLLQNNPDIDWQGYLSARGLGNVPYAIVGQPEFFAAVDGLIRSQPLSDWKVYMRWHVLHAAAPFLCHDAEEENFNFYGKVLSGQLEQEPRWKRAFRTLDGSIGEAVGQLYVEKYFPPEARARMKVMVEDIKTVYHDRLEKADWMAEATRAKALAKFARFSQKIGCPDKFRDYSSIKITRDDYWGNVCRAAAFEEHREMARVGKPVDRTEWDMTPPTVNAYFNPLQNEIVFPAGILQPPFFDPAMDDAVNYGGIGAVIGHEITHGYDDQGRKYDADGNLNDWWTKADAKEFEARAQKVVDEYNAFEPLPGVHVNGRLTLGENLADLGGVTIAYNALERDLARDPSKRKTIDGYTPEQRFFIAFAQLWRNNIREAEARRLVTVDPHSPGRFRAIGPLMNFQPFFEAFDIKSGEAMWRDPDLRAHIW